MNSFSRNSMFIKTISVIISTVFLFSSTVKAGEISRHTLRQDVGRFLSEISSERNPERLMHAFRTFADVRDTVDLDALFVALRDAALRNRDNPGLLDVYNEIMLAVFRRPLERYDDSYDYTVDTVPDKDVVAGREGHEVPSDRISRSILTVIGRALNLPEKVIYQVISVLKKVVTLRRLALTSALLLLPAWGGDKILVLILVIVVISILILREIMFPVRTTTGPWKRPIVLLAAIYTVALLACGRSSSVDDDTAGDDDTTGDDDTVGDDDAVGDDDTAGDDDTVGDDDITPVGTLITDAEIADIEERFGNWIEATAASYTGLPNSHHGDFRLNHALFTYDAAHLVLRYARTGNYVEAKRILNYYVERFNRYTAADLEDMVDRNDVYGILRLLESPADNVDRKHIINSINTAPSAPAAYEGEGRVEWYVDGGPLAWLAMSALQLLSHDSTLSTGEEEQLRIFVLGLAEAILGLFWEENIVSAGPIGQDTNMFEYARERRGSVEHMWAHYSFLRQLANYLNYGPTGPVGPLFPEGYREKALLILESLRDMGMVVRDGDTAYFWQGFIEGEIVEKVPTDVQARGILSVGPEKLNEIFGAGTAEGMLNWIIRHSLVLTDYVRPDGYLVTTIGADFTDPYMEEIQELREGVEPMIDNGGTPEVILAIEVMAEYYDNNGNADEAEELLAIADALKWFAIQRAAEVGELLFGELASKRELETGFGQQTPSATGGSLVWNQVINALRDINPFYATGDLVERLSSIDRLGVEEGTRILLERMSDDYKFSMNDVLQPGYVPAHVGETTYPSDLDPDSGPMAWPGSVIKNAQAVGEKLLAEIRAKGLELDESGYENYVIAGKAFNFMFEIGTTSYRVEHADDTSYFTITIIEQADAGGHIATENKIFALPLSAGRIIVPDKQRDILERERPREQMTEHETFEGTDEIIRLMLVNEKYALLESDEDKKDFVDIWRRMGVDLEFHQEQELVKEIVPRNDKARIHLGHIGGEIMELTHEYLEGKDEIGYGRFSDVFLSLWDAVQLGIRLQEIIGEEILGPDTDAVDKFARTMVTPGNTRKIVLGMAVEGRLNLDVVEQAFGAVEYAGTSVATMAPDYRTKATLVLSDTWTWKESVENKLEDILTDEIFSDLVNGLRINGYGKNISEIQRLLLYIRTALGMSAQDVENGISISNPYLHTVIARIAEMAGFQPHILLEACYADLIREGGSTRPRMRERVINSAVENALVEVGKVNRKGLSEYGSTVNSRLAEEIRGVADGILVKGIEKITLPATAASQIDIAFSVSPLGSSL